MHENDQDSLQRDYPTFMPDDYTIANSPSKIINLPQKLDLSTLNVSKSKNPLKNAKKLSPIKSYHNSELEIDENRRKNRKLSEKSKDLNKYRRDFEKITDDIMRMSFCSNSVNSITSDRAESISSASSGSTIGQRSISIQIKRIKQLTNRANNNPPTADNNNDEFSESNFQLDDDWEEGNSTRPPSSQTSLQFDVEQPRRGVTSSKLMTSVSNHHQTRRKNHFEDSRVFEKRKTTTGTASDSVCLSDSQLYRMYENRHRHQNPGDPDRTLVKMVDDVMSDVTNDLQKTIVDVAFEGYPLKTNSEETPILRAANNESGLPAIERQRAAASPLQNIQMASVRFDDHRRPEFDGFAPGALRHSISTATMSPRKLRTLQKNDDLVMTASLPNLSRFVIPASTRNMFPMPLDIDELNGKMLRRNEKSSKLNFGGEAAATQIHGEARKTPPARNARPPKPPASNSQRPTSSSAAKQRPTVTTVPRRAAYCSATPTDGPGTAHSIMTVSQQLLGTVKRLHPDWTPVIRRLLNSASGDVYESFRDHLLKEHAELKTLIPEEEDVTDARLKIAVIRRILEKIDELRSPGNSEPRIQQIKNLNNAILMG